MSKEIIRFHGMTLEEIKAKYYIEFDGEESPGQLQMINGKLSRLWQDVAYYYSHTESQLSSYKRRFETVEATIEYKKNQVKWNYITENKVLPPRSKWSDSARETAAEIEIKSNPEIVAQLNEIKEGISILEDELSVWHRIRQNLRFIADRINNTTMDIAIENKLARSEPTNIPDMSDLNKKIEVKKETPISDESSLF